MKPEDWAALLAALGAGAVLLELVKATVKWASGRVGRETDAVARERTRANEADVRADALDRSLDMEIGIRRQMERYTAKLERLLIINGIDFAGIEEGTIPRDRLAADRGEGKAV